MNLNDLMIKNKESILRRWFDLILETYPQDTVNMMRKDQDPFTNPVGSTISRGIEVIFRKLCENIYDDECQESLHLILKIRSVQNLSPSKAVEFVFFLKRAIEETLGKEILKESLVRQWLDFQSRIDQMILWAFNLYMETKEKIFEIRVNQARVERDMAFRMMERISRSKDR